MKHFIYEIGKYQLEITCDNAITMPDSFNPFIVNHPDKSECKVSIEKGKIPQHILLNITSPPLEQTNNHQLLMWRLKDSYIFIYRNQGIMICSSKFSNAKIILFKSECMNENISYFLHILWCQLMVFTGKACICHASCIELDGYSYLFTGRSGAGKSTQSRLWTDVMGANLINDDNPIIGINEKSEIIVYGSPWSGKTPCYLKKSYPLKGIFRIHKSQKNDANYQDYIDAYKSFFPSCSCIRTNTKLQLKLNSIIINIITKTHFIDLYCNLSREAPIFAYNYISDLNNISPIISIADNII